MVKFYRYAFVTLLLITLTALTVTAQGKKPKPSPSPTPTPAPTPEPTPIEPCYSGPGCLDGSFGVGGMSLTFITADAAVNAAGAAVQSDGKILALMWPLLNSGTEFTGIIIRYNADGSVDQLFGNAGFVYLNWTAQTGYRGLPFAIATQMVGGEERIVVAGTGSGYYTTPLRVDRFLSDGSVDTSFGTGGSTSINVGYAASIAIQPDGKIVTAGGSGTLARFNVNGTLDTSFGNGGYVQNSIWKIQSIALQSDGRIVGAGKWTAQNGVNQMSVWRFNTNGSLDDGRRNSDSTPGDMFGDKGHRKIDFSANANASSIRVGSDGKIIVAGSANGNFAAARLTTSGALDSTFGSSGKVTVDFSGLTDSASSISVSSTGKLVMVGHTMTTSTNRNIGLVRLNSNGSLDLAFGQGGRAVADTMQDGEFTSDGMIQIDPMCACEKIIAVGSASTGGLRHSMVARLLF